MKNKPLQYVEYSQEEVMKRGLDKKVIPIPINRKLTLIKNGKNLGFVEGKNIGICGSKLYFYSKPDLVQFAGEKFIGILERLNKSVTNNATMNDIANSVK